jgi:hypothetical protein
VGTPWGASMISLPIDEVLPALREALKYSFL